MPHTILELLSAHALNFYSLLPGKFCHAFLSSADFVQNQRFLKILAEILS